MTMTEPALKELSARVTVLETKDAVDEVHRGNIITRLSSIEDTLKWLVRLAVGGLLMGLVAFVVNGGLIIP